MIYPDLLQYHPDCCKYADPSIEMAHCGCTRLTAADWASAMMVGHHNQFTGLMTERRMCLEIKSPQNNDQQ